MNAGSDQKVGQFTPQSTTPHTCAVTDCKVEIARGFLMCGKHWKLLPHQLQSLVNRTYWGWQNGGKLSCYLKARREAIAAVQSMRPLFVQEP